ncbi:hypothetical protein [Fluviicola taffensis]|uniref:hypothetical protein n=1 Tax=Fluviicola taffensis TaxID=191579 RepID=UPI003137BD60
MKKNSRLLLVMTMISLIGCQNADNVVEEYKKRDEAKNELISKVYSDNNLKSQLFTIDNTKDTSIVSKNGTIYRIYRNSFMFSNSSKVPSNIEVEIKEALSPVDFVMGNLTTTSGDKMLESGGMIYINATSDNKQLELAKDTEIGVMLPDDSMKEGMSIFEGKEEGGKIDWVEPIPVMNEELKSLEQSFITIRYYHIGGETASKEENNKVENWLWELGRKPGDKVTFGQSKIEIISIFKDTKALKEGSNSVFTQEVIINKGENGFVEDFNTSYIFSVKKLGWANIDRLFSEPKSKEVNMLVSVDNEDEFGYVYTSLILPEYNMYLPGYQKKDDKFNFSHDDSEKMILPIGAKAKVLATAYKEGEPYFCMKDIIIDKEMNLSMNLKPIKLSDLKKELEKRI